MSRRPGAGHAGAQGNPPRCKDCGHRRGLRSLGRQVKDSHGVTTGNTKKKPCSHECHLKGEPQVVELEESEDA